ncbi:MAG: GNAT family N-acetyltransferase, partial [Verrucomicrobiota bacterium]|nr:GNAT family N-acetyltransferase [Verrucomicrobiota bacterium]
MKQKTRRIRPAEFKDAVSIFMLVRSHPRELLGRSISDIVQNIDRFLVCAPRGKVVGVVSWQILAEIGAPKDPTIEIKSLAVEASRRRSGIGRALVERAIEHIRRLRPSKIIVLTFHPKFFTRFGFREVPKESLMYKL